MTNVYLIPLMIAGSTALSGFIGYRTDRRTQRFERRAGR